MKVFADYVNYYMNKERKNNEHLNETESQNREGQKMKKISEMLDFEIQDRIQELKKKNNDIFGLINFNDLDEIEKLEDELENRGW